MIAVHLLFASLFALAQGRAEGHPGVAAAPEVHPAPSPTMTAVPEARPGPFEGALSGVRDSVLEESAARAKERKDTLAREITGSASRIRELNHEAARWSREAEAIERRSRRPYDPGLGRAARDLAWGLRGLHERADAEAAFLYQLMRYVRWRDPSLRQPAWSLESAARSLVREADWAARRAAQAAYGLRWAGFYPEAASIERESADAAEAARLLEAEARRLRELVD